MYLRQGVTLPAHVTLNCRPFLPGRVDYWFASADCWQSSHPGGLEVFYFPTGQVMPDSIGFGAQHHGSRIPACAVPVDGGGPRQPVDPALTSPAVHAGPSHGFRLRRTTPAASGRSSLGTAPRRGGCCRVGARRTWRRPSCLPPSGCRDPPPPPLPGAQPPRDDSQSDSQSTILSIYFTDFDDPPPVANF